MAQVQCPNCGGYRITENVESIKEWRLLTKPPLSWWNLLWGTPLVFFAFLVLVGTVKTSTLAVTGMFMVDYLIWGGLGFLPVYMVGFTIFSHIKGSYRENKKVEVSKAYHYHCQLCGYSWTWRTGEPQPKINIRPDLIAKGNQRLEEEHRVAAAVWWQQEQERQRKKK